MESRESLTTGLMLRVKILLSHESVLKVCKGIKEVLVTNSLPSILDSFFVFGKFAFKISLIFYFSVRNTLRMSCGLAHTLLELLVAITAPRGNTSIANLPHPPVFVTVVEEEVVVCDLRRVHWVCGVLRRVHCVWGVQRRVHCVRDNVCLS